MCYCDRVALIYSALRPAMLQHTATTMEENPGSSASGRCGACGAEVKKIMYQSRAADEAHTTIWSCDNCPLNSNRISVGDLRPSKALSFPRVYHRRTTSARDSRCHSRICTRLTLEMSVPNTTYVKVRGDVSENIRSPVAVRVGDYPVPIRGHVYFTGEHKGSLVVQRSSEELSPKVTLVTSDVYRAFPGDENMPRERDGHIQDVMSGSGRECYIHSRLMERGYSYTVVVHVRSAAQADISSSVSHIHSTLSSTLNMRWMVDSASSSHIHNLSPRAWDVLDAEGGAHVYTEKVDGERCYILVYDACAYMFRKGAGYPLVGWKSLTSRTKRRKPIIFDVENTISHGLFLIDMLTDPDGNPAPSDRDMNWVLSTFVNASSTVCPLRIRVRRYYAEQARAEAESKKVSYPTDGVVAIRIDGTSAKKIKAEKAVELRVTDSMSLITSDGDVVVKRYPNASNISPGDIVELKFKLGRTGKYIISGAAFKRVDKTDANSTSATLNIIRSFRGVTKDSETRRRSALMWCDSLRARLFLDVLREDSPKSIIMDIGTGTGQSLDVMTPGRGVSYLLVEPDSERAEMLRRRTGGAKVLTEPRGILGHIKHLKSGSETYVIANCQLDDILEDEDVARLLSQELRAATAVFSAQYVIAGLYDLANVWSVPLIGCMYTYDGVSVGDTLVDALGVEMRRASDSVCTVKWGGDRVYEEPYTTSNEYKAFSSVFSASDVQDLPDREIDELVSDICSKVKVIKS